MAAIKGASLLTLVCDVHRAQADSSLQQRGHLSLIKDLTQTAKVICRNVACLDAKSFELHSYILIFVTQIWRERSL